MDVGYVGRDVLHSRENIGLLALQFVHPRLHRRLIPAVLNGGHHAGNATLDLVQRIAVKFRLHPAFTVLTVERFCVGPDGLRHRVGRNELLGESCQNAGLDLLPKDRVTIVAGPAAIAVEAAIAVAGDEAIIAAAAFEQAGEQKGRAVQFVDVLGTVGAHTLGDVLELLGDFLLPPPRRLP